MKKFSKGFTLIELLVVIAIIGILSSVVLVSLNTARSKGKDARVQTELSQLRTQFEADYSGSAYPGTCSTAAGCQGTTDANGAATGFPTGANYVTVAEDIHDQNSEGVKFTFDNGVTKYAIYAKLPSSGTTAVYQCLDSSGGVKTASAGPGTVSAVTAGICQ